MIGSVKKNSGFTFMEVVLALAILAVAFTALSTLQAKNIKLTAEDQKITRETLAARDVIARVRAGIIPVEDNEGEIGDDFPGWRWRIRTEDLAEEGLKRVTVRIFEEQTDPEEGEMFWFLVFNQETS